MFHIRCAKCGGALVSEPSTVVVWFAKRHAHVEVRADRCVACGDTFHDPAELAHARREAIASYRTGEGLLSPGELVAIRTRLGLTQWEMEQVLRVGANTVVRWERGTVFQSTATDSLIRVIAEVPGAYAFLADLVDLNATLKQRR